jgi:hypothetical protein
MAAASGAASDSVDRRRIFPMHGSTLDDVIRVTDLAVYQAKWMVGITSWWYPGS